MADNYISSPVGTVLTTGGLVLSGSKITSTQTATTTATVNLNAGTGALLSLANATDVAGKVTLLCGTSPSAGAQGTVNFSSAYGVAPVVILTPASANAGENAVQVFVTSSITAFTLNFVVAGTNAETYTYHYHVIQTQ